MDAAVVTVTAQKHAIDTGYEHLNFMSDLIKEILRENPHLIKEDAVKEIFDRHDDAIKLAEKSSSTWFITEM